jgi:hypothetical protein
MVHDASVAVTYMARFVAGAVRAYHPARAVVWACAFRTHLRAIRLPANRLCADSPQTACAAMGDAAFGDLAGCSNRSDAAQADQSGRGFLRDLLGHAAAGRAVPGAGPASPPTGSRIFFEDGVVLAFAASPHLYFQARAPPQA